MKAALANSLWLAGCLSEAARFRQASRHVAAEQWSLLRHLLAANQETKFGRAHGFSSIRSVREYQRQVPLRDYDGFQEWIDRAAAGELSVLTRDPVRLFEPTGGSSAATKLIPYTESLQREFQKAIRAWVADLFLHHPQLLSGPAYWSVSPLTRLGQKTRGGISIGFEDDASYVGGWQKRLVESVMAVPAGLRRITEMDTFRYLTLLFLVRSQNLKLISVWNPTFLALLVERLPEWGEELAYDLEHGTMRTDRAVPDELRTRVRPDKCRASELRASLRTAAAPERHARLWPQLCVISCWADANAASPASHLQAQFPQARIQAKGLIATEGFVSLPLVGDEGAALAVRSHFLEFLPVNSSGDVDSANPHLAHELERGGRYSVVFTTGGGLYRYQLHDLVEVSGHIHQCPMVRFRGRLGQVSDWFGEKLNEAHVAAILREVFDSLELKPAFAMLACDTREQSPGYVLYIDAIGPDEWLGQAGAHIETGLCCNYHYRCARELGQLAPLRVFRAAGAAAIYLAASIKTGQRAGDVKPLALDRRNGWSQIFPGHFVKASAPCVSEAASGVLGTEL